MQLYLILCVWDTDNFLNYSSGARESPGSAAIVKH